MIIPSYPQCSAHGVDTEPRALIEHNGDVRQEDKVRFDHSDGREMKVLDSRRTTKPCSIVEALSNQCDVQARIRKRLQGNNSLLSRDRVLYRGPPSVASVPDH